MMAHPQKIVGRATTGIFTSSLTRQPILEKETFLCRPNGKGNLLEFVC